MSVNGRTCAQVMPGRTKSLPSPTSDAKVNIGLGWASTGATPSILSASSLTKKNRMRDAAAFLIVVTVVVDATSERATTGVIRLIAPVCAVPIGSSNSCQSEAVAWTIVGSGCPLPLTVRSSLVVNGHQPGQRGRFVMSVPLAPPNRPKGHRRLRG